MGKNPSIDLLKGVLILLVMGGHVMELTGAHHLALWVGSGFRMPLMVGISGYLLNVTRTRDDAALSLLSRYGRRMLLPWAIAVAVYVVASHWRFTWETPFDLLLRPPFHLWYVPVLFFLIMVTRLLPYPPLVLLAIGTPFSLAVMYGFGLNHGPVADGVLAMDSRFLRYPVYFFFGMLMAQRGVDRRSRWLALLIAGLGIGWWAALKASGDNLAYVPARLLMCLGLISLLPTLSALRIYAAPLNAIGRNSLFFYLWHPMAMGFIITTGAEPLSTLAVSVLLLAIGSRIAARSPLTALLMGCQPEQRRPSPVPSGEPVRA
ncbi:MAG TPA: acyltransferase [Sphingobium sp.]